MASPDAHLPREDAPGVGWRFALGIGLAVAAIELAVFLAGDEYWSLRGDNRKVIFGLIGEAFHGWADRRVPLWSPLIWGGYPLAADPTAGVFYPPYHLAFALTPHPHLIALDVSTALHAGWLAAGVAMLAGRLGATRGVAAWAALALAASPQLLLWSTFHTRFAPIAWLPWAWLAADALANVPAGERRAALRAAVLGSDPRRGTVARGLPAARDLHGRRRRAVDRMRAGGVSARRTVWCAASSSRSSSSPSPSRSCSRRCRSCRTARAEGRSTTRTSTPTRTRSTGSTRAPRTWRSPTGSSVRRSSYSAGSHSPCAFARARASPRSLSCSACSRRATPRRSTVRSRRYRCSECSATRRSSTSSPLRQSRCSRHSGCRHRCATDDAACAAPALALAAFAFVELGVQGSHGVRHVFDQMGQPVLLREALPVFDAARSQLAPPPERETPLRLHVQVRRTEGWGAYTSGAFVYGLLPTAYGFDQWPAPDAPLRNRAFVDLNLYAWTREAARTPGVDRVFVPEPCPEPIPRPLMIEIDGAFCVLRYRREAPRYELLPRAQHVASYDEMIRRMRGAEGPRIPVVVDPARRGLGAHASGHVEVRRFEPGRVLLRVRSDGDGVLLARESWGGRLARQHRRPRRRFDARRRPVPRARDSGRRARRPARVPLARGARRPGRLDPLVRMRCRPVAPQRRGERLKPHAATARGPSPP